MTVIRHLRARTPLVLIALGGALVAAQLVPTRSPTGAPATQPASSAIVMRMLAASFPASSWTDRAALAGSLAAGARGTSAILRALRQSNPRLLTAVKRISRDVHAWAAGPALALTADVVSALAAARGALLTAGRAVTSLHPAGGPARRAATVTLRALRLGAAALADLREGLLSKGADAQIRLLSMARRLFTQSGNAGRAAARALGCKKSCPVLL